MSVTRKRSTDGDEAKSPVSTADEAASDGRAKRSRTLLRTLTTALAILAAAALWWLWARGPLVKVTPVVSGDAAAVVYATGIVEPVLWAKVAAPQRKRIAEICHCEGKHVTKGEILARLDSDEELAVLKELEARLNRFREDAERLKSLVERNVTARTIYDEKVTQVREQESRVAAQKERIELLTLRAPMDGVVLRRDGEVGEIAGTGTNDVLLWVGNPTPLRVNAEVNEEDIFRVKPGQHVLLRHDGQIEAPLAATVDRITPKGDPQTKTFRVYLSLPGDTPLRIGMSVEANIVVAEAKGAHLVPAEAIGSNAVLTVENGRVRRLPINVGIKGTRLVELRDGPAIGTPVVTPFRADLADGARVRVEAGGGK